MTQLIDDLARPIDCGKAGAWSRYGQHLKQWLMNLPEIEGAWLHRTSGFPAIFKPGVPVYRRSADPGVAHTFICSIVSGSEFGPLAMTEVWAGRRGDAILGQNRTVGLAMALCLGRCVAASLAVLVGLGGVALGYAGLAEFLAQDGQLRDELRVRDGQHGVVGETGTLWVIEPSGAFKVSNFVNQKVGPPERAGNLSAEQLELVAQSLASQRFRDLPRQIGEGAPSNARVISVAFGQDTATLMLPPGPPVELERLVAQQAAEAGPRGKLLAIVDTVLEVTAAD